VETIGTFRTSSNLSEVSGLAVSRGDPDLLWVHNDSGDGPTIYALGRDGRLRGRYHFTGKIAVDFEDMAAGPCPPAVQAAACLFVGDVGDNNAIRNELTLYVLAEPSGVPDLDNGTPIELAPELSISVSYEDGPRDTESVFVDSAGGVFLLSKGREGPPAVYQPDQPLRDGATLSMKRIFTFAPDDLDPSSPLVTSADLYPEGGSLLIRSYDSLMLLSLGDAVSAAHLAAGTIRRMPAAIEPQGESVAWEPDGSGYLTVSEQIGTISRVSCLP